MIDVEKALDVAGGGAIIPEKLDPEIRELADKKTPLRKIFKHVPWSSSAYEWNVRTALTSAGFYTETSGFAEGKSTLARRSVTFKMIKSEGAVSNLLQMASKDYTNALQLEIEGATKSIAQAEEDALINGDSATPEEFNGLDVSITNTVDCLGSAINFDILDDAIAEVRDQGGEPDLILLASRDKSKLDKLMRSLVKVNWEKVETKYGVRLQAYQDIPVVGSAFVPTNLNYGATPTGDFSMGFVLDSSDIIVPELLGITYEEVNVATDSLAFRLKTYITLAIKAAEIQRKIINIAKP